MIKTIFFDMDGTLIDFARSNLPQALVKMRDMHYYADLTPLYSDIWTLEKLKKYYKLGVVSGIPDNKMHNLGMNSRQYESYFNYVMEAKSLTLQKYYPNIFDCELYIEASDSKVQEVESRGFDIKQTMLIDDMYQYIDQWREGGGLAYQVSSPREIAIICEMMLDFARSEQ